MDQTLELVWQQDATAILFVRDADGALSAGDLTLGKPGIGKLALAGDGFPARRLDVQQLIRLADAPPAEPAAGGTARAIFALVELAQRSVAEGLVHPELDHGGGWWHAFWGATLDQSVQAALTEIAAALPPVSADAFDGDREATVHDLYPCSSTRSRATGCSPTACGWRRAAEQVRPTALDQFLEGLTPLTPSCHGTPGYSALDRRLSGWVDDGPRAPHVNALADRPAPRRARKATRSCSSCGCRPRTIRRSGLPASLLWSGGDDGFAFLRDGDPRRRPDPRSSTELEPLLAELGIEFDAAEPDEAALDAETVRLFLRDADAAARGARRAGAAAGGVGALADAGHAST